MRPAFLSRSPWRNHRRRQPLFAFLERSRRRQRLFKRLIIALTATTVAAMIGLSSAGRYHARVWSGAIRDAVELRLVGSLPRERIEADWRVRRRRGIEMAHERLSSFYRETTEEMRALFRVAGMDPEHALIRYGRADQGFVISPQVFDRDDRGRSYRLRPNTRSVWLRQITLHNGPLGMFEVLDTPEHRAAALAAGAIVDERSVQHTNSWGLRGPEPDMSVPIRGIVLGDSFMQGMFNGDEDTPPIQLQRYLESAWKMPVAVVNTGHIGYSPEQYYYSLLEYGDRVQPDFVVVSVCPNDFGHDKAVLEGRGDWFDEAGYWLERIRELCDSHRATCLLVPVPTHLQLEFVRRDEAYPAPLCQIFRTASFGYCDPLNDFTDEFLRLRRVAKKEGRSALKCPLYNYEISDNHFSPRGAALWARVVGRRLTLLIDPAADGPDSGLSARSTKRLHLSGGGPARPPARAASSKDRSPGDSRATSDESRIDQPSIARDPLAKP